MTEKDIRRIAREEALKVLREYLARMQARKVSEAKREQANHAAAMEEAFGPHGQG